MKYGSRYSQKLQNPAFVRNFFRSTVSNRINLVMPMNYQVGNLEFCARRVNPKNVSFLEKLKISFSLTERFVPLILFWFCTESVGVLTSSFFWNYRKQLRNKVKIIKTRRQWRKLQVFQGGHVEQNLRLFSQFRTI